MKQSNSQLMLATIQIQYSYFYSNARQIYLYLGLRNDIKIAKKKMPSAKYCGWHWHIKIIKTCDIIWHFFKVKLKHWTLYHNVYVSISKKNPIISYFKCGWCLFFLSYCLIDMFNFKNSIWQLIHTRTLSYSMSIVDLTATIGQWKNVLYDNWIIISYIPFLTFFLNTI